MHMDLLFYKHNSPLHRLFCIKISLTTGTVNSEVTHQLHPEKLNSVCKGSDLPWALQLGQVGWSVRDVQLGGGGVTLAVIWFLAETLLQRKEARRKISVTKQRFCWHRRATVYYMEKKRERERFGFSENKEEMEDRIFFFNLKTNE